MIMDKNALLKMAKNPDFISGIYNYCDRWCERCAFTRRCMVFAMEEKESSRPEGLDMRNREFWDGIDGMFNLTMELVQDLAKERGIDLNAVDKEGAMEEHMEKQRRAKNHPLARDAKRYATMVKEWLNLHEALFREREEALQKELELGIAEPEVTAAELIEAVEVIRWYQHQIAVKLMRSLGGREPAEEMEEFPSDSDGSAKVALIGIERSIGAWGSLGRLLPDDSDDILKILIHLGRLRQATERQFPRARRFVRPGFDQEI
jgi:hypothetical protein